MVYRGGSVPDQELLVGHLVMGSSPAQPAVKAGQLQLQPLAQRKMQCIPCPQRRRLDETETGCGLEILGYQLKGLETMLTQDPKPLPGCLRFLRCDRVTSHLESQGRRQFSDNPGRDQPGLLGVRLQKSKGRGCACFMHQRRHEQGGVEEKALQ